MIKLEKEKKVWITSDTHYGHTNICRGVTNWRLPNGDIPVNQTRDFPTIEKMNAAIVNNTCSQPSCQVIADSDSLLQYEIGRILKSFTFIIPYTIVCDLLSSIEYAILPFESNLSCES